MTLAVTQLIGFGARRPSSGGAYSGFTSWDSAAMGAGFTLSNGDLTATLNVNNQTVRAKTAKTTGKHYWEVTWHDDANGGYALIGIANSSASLATYLGGDANGWALYAFNGQKYNSTSGASYGSSYAVGTVVGVALDLDNGAVWFRSSSTWPNSGNPATNTNPAYSGLSGSLMPAAGYTGAAGSKAFTINVGGSAFSYSVPSGFNGT